MIGIRAILRGRVSVPPVAVVFLKAASPSDMFAPPPTPLKLG